MSLKATAIVFAAGAFCGHPALKVLDFRGRKLHPYLAGELVWHAFATSSARRSWRWKGCRSGPPGYFGAPRLGVPPPPSPLAHRRFGRVGSGARPPIIAFWRAKFSRIPIGPPPPTCPSGIDGAFWDG